MTIARTICLGFIAVIAAGTLLLILPFSTSAGSWGNPIVALFTSTSAVCVTGLVVVDTGTYFSFWGELFITLLIQIGGLGYMLTTTFLMLLIGKRFELRQKFAIRESFDRPFLQGSQNIVRSVIATTLAFEIAGALLLFIKFTSDFGPIRGLWFAIFHSVSAWNNAGFGLLKDNMISYRSSYIINFTIPILIIFGGIGYQVIIEMYSWFIDRFKRERFDFSLNYKVAVHTTIFLLIFGTLGYLFLEFTNPQTFGGFNLKDKLLAAWFQSVVTRTAGFNSIDFGQLTISGLFLTMGLMFIGASPSGTGGGIKTTTLRILTSSTRAVLRGQEQVVLYEREVSVSLVLKAVAVVFGSAMTVLGITFAIALIEYSFLKNPIFINGTYNSIHIAFEVISAFCTVGLSTGITAPLSPYSQLLLVLAMYTGRVGVLLFMAAIIGDPRPSALHYPEENLLVG
ncbi:TrkH family potassium uptake protein [Gloeothece verrucosa]|uniref:Potassium uptake protein, TrkH family n=1 Tax=Gloeothece verrucosa (strain PCC 7822) TaxID=497965 RepID=E0UE58_GLOV7|nr:TrkH family potassium uptake protein [Gloeothece verrucosa]ADN14183.1 potassium uptake protein, TrkH family [Gloeothece verrucosa PCC 7822]